MVLRIFATMFLSHLLVSCDSRLSDEGQKNQNKPFYQPWGVDLEARNEAVNPGDDFFGYANGNWIANNEIPSDRSRHGGGRLVDAEPVAPPLSSTLGRCDGHDHGR